MHHPSIHEILSASLEQSANALVKAGVWYLFIFHQKKVLKNYAKSFLFRLKQSFSS